MGLSMWLWYVQSPLRKEISKAKHDCKLDRIPNNSSEKLFSLTIIPPMISNLFVPYVDLKEKG